MNILKETKDFFENFGKVLERLNIGRSFRIFGGLGLLIALSENNPLSLKIAVITFIFGAISKIIEMLNKLWPKKTVLQVLIWLLFLITYSFSINNVICLF